MKTQVTTYYFDISKEDQKIEYKALCKKLRAEGLTMFDVWEDTRPSKGKKVESGDVELCTAHLFDNQWNTTSESEVNKDFRLMDWKQSIYPNKKIKSGYYLKQTKEMREVRQTTLKCGYCGHLHKADEGKEICDKCTNSQYLTEDHYHFLKLLPVADTNNKRTITAEQRESLHAIVVKAKTEAAKAIKPALREKYIAECEKSTNEAETKRDGFLWMIDNDINIENCIYYSHTNIFCFGWMEKVSEDEKKALCEKLQGFPMNVEFKTA